MKCFAIAVFLASALLVAHSEDDGKYRPTEAPITTNAILRTIPTTRLPIVPPVVPAVYPGSTWNSRRYWPNERYNPNERYDPRYENRFDTRYNPNVGIAAKPYPVRPLYNDYRTIRLDEKVDAKGYRYVYETVGGILAEEVGTFENVGLKTEGIRIQGYVQITDPQGVSFRIDYQADSKDAYIPRGDGREPPRTPPSIVKLLALMELHK